jgi:hypothetical protein
MSAKCHKRTFGEDVLDFREAPFNVGYLLN